VKGGEGKCPPKVAGQKATAKKFGPCDQLQILVAIRNRSSSSVLRGTGGTGKKGVQNSKKTCGQKTIKFPETSIQGPPSSKLAKKQGLNPSGKGVPRKKEKRGENFIFTGRERKRPSTSERWTKMIAAWSTLFTDDHDAR